ncbi:hypothetical protein A9Q91_00615 [Candidatus Gracilibacteria bacterium 28_42_T64]|nr:hypothetical protein A9Q91_00615 [Candidatus Gracilibacteria bacterium 28_42_T64]
MSYHDLINIEEFEKRDTFNSERGGVSFYCKDCKKIVETDRKNPKGYTFLCTICKGKNIVIGTHEGLRSNYKIK